MLDSLKPQLTTLGATVLDSGSNTAADGDSEYFFDFARDGAQGSVRLIALEGGHEHAMVVTIDASS